MAHYPQRQKWPWRPFTANALVSLPRTIVMILMSRDSNLGQMLLRDRMPPPALFLKLDDAHASAEDTYPGKKI